MRDGGSSLSSTPCAGSTERHHCFSRRASTLSFLAPRHSFPSHRRTFLRPISALSTSLIEVINRSNHGISLVSIILVGGGRGGYDMGKRDADRYRRYQAKLKTAPLLTQAITTGVRILPGTSGYAMPHRIPLSTATIP
jgi:hypothetical protein